MKLLRVILRAGVMEDGQVRQPVTGTPQGGVVTPPTQLATWTHVTLRVGVVVFLVAHGGAFPDGDAVPDGDLLGSDEDVFDEQPQYPLAFCGTGGAGVVAQLGEEAIEVVGQLGELGVDGVELAAQVRFAGTQAGHPGAQLVDGDQLLGERPDHRSSPGSSPARTGRYAGLVAGHHPGRAALAARHRRRHPTPGNLSILARAQQTVDPAQAEQLVRGVLAQAAASEDFRVASAAAGNLGNLLIDAGKLHEALDLVDLGGDDVGDLVLWRSPGLLPNRSARPENPDLGPASTPSKP